MNLNVYALKKSFKTVKFVDRILTEERRQVQREQQVQRSHEIHQDVRTLELFLNDILSKSIVQAPIHNRGQNRIQLKRWFVKTAELKLDISTKYGAPEITAVTTGGNEGIRRFKVERRPMNHPRRWNGSEDL